MILAKILRPTNGSDDKTSALGNAEVVAVVGLDGESEVAPEGIPLMEVKRLIGSFEDDFKIGMALLNRPDGCDPGPYRSRCVAIDSGDGKFDAAMRAKFGDLYVGFVPVFDVYGKPLEGAIIKPGDFKTGDQI
jgi:hypothetical protein